MNAHRQASGRTVIGVALTMAIGYCVAWCFAQEARPASAADVRAGQVLYNGIALPATWPPRMQQLPRDPVTPPYLASPPEVIPIDVGPATVRRRFPDPGNQSPAHVPPRGILRRRIPFSCRTSRGK